MFIQILPYNTPHFLTTTSPSTDQAVQDGSIELFNAAGKVVQTLDLGTEMSGKMTISQLPAGMYFYRWSSGDIVSKTKKLIVQ